ncbi:MAG TPA: carboxypeptidase-like regulatory domain-containing protein [Solirubrobacteraceae bacterium]
MRLVTMIAVFLVVSANAVAHPSVRVSHRCHVPRLTGLVLNVARSRAAHSGCRLRVKGAALEAPQVQTVERQSPARGERSPEVTVWLNPLCHGSAAYGPGFNEPLLTAGPTELVSGFYLDGGPLARFSDRGCKRPGPPPGAGTVEVANASGTLVGTETSTYGHLITIPLPPGSYTITGTFLGATINGVHPRISESVVVPPGETVRQDFFLSIP